MLLATLFGAALAPHATRGGRDAAVIAALDGHLHRRAQTSFSADARYGIAFEDLNGDGRDEAIVYLLDKDFCGSGGCMTFVFAQRRNRWTWTWVSSTTLTNLPIFRLPTRSHGWHDIGVSIRSDYVRGGLVALRFNGRRYTANPTIAPKTFRRAQSEEIISQDDLHTLQRNR